jgi:spermidine/putrescine transport system ATP-binding protein
MDIYERPASRFVAEFIGRMNFFPGRVVAGRAGLRVVTAGGAALDLPLPSGVGEASPVQVAVRPERARVSIEPPPGHWLAEQGRIEQVLYLGAAHEVRVGLEGGGRALVEAPNTGTSVGLEPGTAVWFAAPPEACLVLPGGA